MSVTTPRRRRPYAARVPLDVRREQLLDAAIEVIVRDGYSAVSIDAIAREAGVTRPVVYGAYDGLGALLTALLDRHEKRALAQLADALDGDLVLSDPDEFLLAAGRRLADAVAADPWTWRPILLAPQGFPAELQQRINRDREQVRQQIAGLLDLGLPLRGGPELDTEVMSHALLAVLEHFGRLLLEEPARFDAERLVDAMRGLLAGLRPS